MSLLPKTFGLDKVRLISLKKGKLPKELIDYLEAVHDKHEEVYKLLRDAQAGSGAAETPNWEIKEADASDVTNGYATAAGNLIVKHRTSGTKYEFEA